MANEWGSTKMEFLFDGFIVNAVHQRGEERDIELVYKNNLNTIERVIESSNIATRVKGRGKNGLTIEGLDIANLTEEDLVGATYQDGKITADYVDSDLIEEYAEPKEIIMRWEYIENQLDLLKVMQKYIKTVDTPEITYRVSFVELDNQGIPFSQIEIGDVIHVIDHSLGIQERVRVIELDKNPLMLELSVATLATQRKSIIDYFAEINNTKKYVDVKVEEIESTVDGIYERMIQTEQILVNPNAMHNDEGIFTIDSNSLNESGKIEIDGKLIKISDGKIHRSIDSGHSLHEVINAYGLKADQLIGDITINKKITGEAIPDDEDDEIKEIGNIYAQQSIDDETSPEGNEEPEIVMTIGNYIHSMTEEPTVGIQIKKENLDVIGDMDNIAVFA